MSLKVKSAALAILSITLFPTYGMLAQDSGPESEFLKKPSEFELERMAPRTELDMLSTNLAGENISLADGGLSFSNIDVSVPTDMAISATIKRTYQRLSGLNDKDASAFGDWKLDIPRIESTVLFGDSRESRNFHPETACSRLFSPGSVVGALGQTIDQISYWNGATLSLVGQGGGKLLQGETGYKTTTNTLVSCHTASDNSQYFQAKTSEGITYEFKQRRVIHGFPLIRKFKAAGRAQLQYLVTKITDRFNNELHYNYTDENLTSITSKAHGSPTTRALISLVYINNVVESVTANGKTWQYKYDDAHNQQRLTSVTLPDQRQWLYNFPFFIGYAPKFEIKGTTIYKSNQEPANPAACDYIGLSDLGNKITVTHPHGATATFDYELLVHGKTEVPADKMNRSPQSSKPAYNINSCYAAIAIKKKTLTVNDDIYTWNYDYSNNTKHWNIDKWLTGELTSPYTFNQDNVVYGNAATKKAYCDTKEECRKIPTHFGFEQLDLRVLKVIGPSGSKIKHYISKRWDHTEGKVVATQILDTSDNVLNTTIKQFSINDYKGDAGLHDHQYSTNIAPIHNQIVTASHTEIRNNDTYFTDYQAYNEYGALLVSKSYNSYSNNQRFVKHTYQHDTTNHLLNLPSMKQVSSDGSNWVTVNEATYYPANSNYPFLPHQQKIMGNVVRTYSQYHGDGNIKRIDYQGTNQYELYENYKLGKAQKVTLPCSSTNGCGITNSSTANTVVALMNINDNGTVDSITNFKGQTTHYDYDGMGRLTNIDIADSSWNDTNITYTTTSDNLFLQQITKGKYKKQTYYDSLLRPIYTLEQDITSSASTKHVTQQFNHNNQVVFLSYPSNVKNTTVGIVNEYDALGRIIETRSTDNEIVTTREYLSGNEIIATDSNGYSTTTAYLAYGNPAQKLPTEIRSPEQVTTSITYNYLDQVSAINQGGVTETRIYDELGQLCKTHRPDVGMAAFGYDSQRRPVWQYSGNLSNSGSCTVTSTQREQAMSISYDNQGNIWKQQFSDNTPDKTFEYDDVGLLKSLIAGAVTWSYSYDNQNNLTSETLSVDNKSFNIGWSYNANNHLNSITYPSNRTVEYAPNALGQPTKANNYATQLSYTPNGQIESMRLGNNVVKLTEFDVHSRPTLLRDSLSNQDIINYSLGYDGNSNLSYQNDNVNSQKSISSLSYDGLNRLTGAAGSWGIADFQYDGLGNITRKQLGNKVINYQYQNNQLTSVSGSLVKAFDYDNRGNMIKSGSQSLTFNRLNQVTHLNSNQYIYDGYDRRVKAVTNSGTTYSVYSKNGKLIYQVNIDKNDTTDHIYIADKLIAKVTNGLRKPTLNTSEPVLGTGKVTFSWNSIPTATRYELEKKTGSSWSNIYSGSGFSYIATETATGSYEYRLKACNSKKCSSYDNSELINILFKPNAPSEVSVPVTTSQNGNISISWNQPSHTDNFKLYQKSSANSWQYIKSLSAVSYSVNGLGNGSYTYAVEACNAAGCSAKRISNSISVLHPAATPSSINAPKGTDTDGAYTISWSSVSTATKYQLSQKINSGAWAIVSDGTNLNKAFSSKGNASYQYAVRACNASGCSAYKYSSTFSVLLPPVVPSTITVPTGNDVDGAYTVSWPAVSTATKYQLAQKVNNGGWVTVSDNSNRSKAFSGKGNATYQYAVRACNASGCSGYRYSSTFNVLLPPPVPSSISVPTGTDPDGAYTVSWPATSTATRYQLSQKVNTGAWVSVSDGTNRSKAFSGKGNAKYQYAVRACNTSGCSGYRYSATFNVLLPPSVPSSINVPTSTDIDGAFSVSWNSATTATSYSLYQSLNGGSWTTVTSGNFTSKALSGKGNGSYRYAVKACNSSGCSGLKTSASFTVLHPPKTPSSLSLPNSDFDGSFNMNWSASSTTTRYELREKVNTGSWKTIGTNFKSLSYTRTGRGSANYQYGVRACNTSGCSSWRYSGTLINTLMPSSMSAPSVDHDGRFYISWGSVSTRTYYKAQEKTGSGSWKNLLSSTTSTAYTRQGRSSNSYQYRVAACNAHGCSGYRNSGTVVVTLTPSSISYSSKDHDGSFSVSWGSVSTATSYQLEQYKSGRWTTVYTGSSRSKSMSNLTDGNYKYRVKACRSGSCSGYKQGNNIWVIRPNLSLTFASSVVISPQNLKVSWNATGADKCSIQGAQNLSSAGERNIWIGSSKNYSMTCYFGSKTITKSKYIRVKYSGGGGGIDF